MHECSAAVRDHLGAVGHQARATRLREYAMKEEYDFSEAERGKFYRPDAEFDVPVYLDSVQGSLQGSRVGSDQSTGDARHREIDRENGKWSLRELPSAYSAAFAGKMGHLRGENRLRWDASIGIS